MHCFWQLWLHHYSSLFSSCDPLARLGEWFHQPDLQIDLRASDPPDAVTPHAATLPGETFRRVLAICVLSELHHGSGLFYQVSPLSSLVAQRRAQVGVDITSITSGLMGTPNGVLFSMDSSTIVVFIPPRLLRKSLTDLIDHTGAEL